MPEDIPSHEKHVRVIDKTLRKAAARSVEVAEGLTYFITANIEGNPPLFNGSLVRVLQFDEQQNWVNVQILNTTEERKINIHTFHNINAYNCILQRKQIPLSLANATTYHDSQGKTINEMHASFDNLFDRPLLYVALSRLRQLSKLTILFTHTQIHHPLHTLVNQITPSLTKMNPDVVTVDAYITKNNCLKNNTQPAQPLATTSIINYEPNESIRTSFPSQGEPSVYVITDIQTQQLYYIGFSTNLSARFRQHTNGNDLRTRQHAPWKLLFIILGFPFNDDALCKQLGKDLANTNGLLFEKIRNPATVFETRLQHTESNIQTSKQHCTPSPLAKQQFFSK